MNKPKALTAVAAQGVQMSEIFKYGVARQKVGTYTPELVEPEASTGQGKRALQHNRLIPDGGGPALVVGSVHVPERRAELRSYAYVQSVFRQRFRKACPFDPSAYEAFVRNAENLLHGMQMNVHRVDAPAMMADDEGPAVTVGAPNGGSSNTVLWVVLAIVGLFVLGGAGVGVLMFLRR
jgi:hypothetical protein